MAFDWNSPVMKKIKIVAGGVVGLVLLAFGATQMGNDMTDKAQHDLQAPPVIELPAPTVAN